MLDLSQTSDIITAKVYLNGAVLSGEILLQELVVTKAFNKVASARLRFLDGSLSDRDFPLSNDDRFRPGSELKVQLGYDGATETVFEGLIIKHGLKVRSSSAPELLIEAKDKAIKLTGARKSAYFIEQTDADIMAQLAGALPKEIEATSYTHKQVVQYDATDWDFLLLRAEANGMLVCTDDNKLVIKKPSVGAPVLTASLGGNVRDFEAEMDARKTSASVSSQAWDYTQQQAEQSDPGAAVFNEAGNISADELGGVLGAETVLRHPGYLEQAQLQDWTDAYDLRRKLAKIAGRVRIQGNAAVKPGTTIRLDGFGDRFNGAVYVTGVQHFYNGIWHTDVQFGWREDWFYKQEGVMDAPAKGLLPGIRGLESGVVTDLDDPSGQYRVKVRIPSVNGDEGVWARVCTLDAGDGHGSYFRPQLGDEAILGFLGDDPREPLILGYMHSKDSRASPLPVDSNALQYGIVTKEGNKIILDDTNKKMQLIVTASSGEKSLVLNDSGGAIELKDEHGNSIKMESTGITIQSNGKVTIKGSQVFVN